MRITLIRMVLEASHNPDWNSLSFPPKPHEAGWGWPSDDKGPDLDVSVHSKWETQWHFLNSAPKQSKTKQNQFIQFTQILSLNRVNQAIKITTEWGLWGAEILTQYLIHAMLRLRATPQPLKTDLN